MKSKARRRSPGAKGRLGETRRQSNATRSSRLKGNFDRYLDLARSAAMSGDEVTAEGHYQHAEHYYRLMNAAQ